MTRVFTDEFTGQHNKQQGRPCAMFMHCRCTQLLQGAQITQTRFTMLDICNRQCHQHIHCPQTKGETSRNTQAIASCALLRLH